MTTRWTVVLQAAREDRSGVRPAFANLFEQYQQPLYSVSRARGLSHDDAIDALQDFFCELLQDSTLSHADRNVGRFRTFLVTVFRRFLADRARHGAAQKRGGGYRHISINVSDEKTYDLVDPVTPEFDRLFDKQWAETLLALARREVLASYEERGRLQLAETLFPFMTVSIDAKKSTELAEQLDLSPTAVKVALHRLRTRYGQTLRELVAQTVDDPHDVDSELDSLLGSLLKND